MLTNYFTLRALVREWNPLLAGSRLVDAYSQHKGSLILVFASDSGALHSLNLSVQSPNRHLFRFDGSNRSRRNVVDHFAKLRTRLLESIELEFGDRLIYLDFEGGHRLLLAPFGPKANVFHIDPVGDVVDSFKGSLPQTVPEVRPANMPQDAAHVENLLASGRPVRKVWPLLPPALLDEVRHRAGLTEDPVALFNLASEVIAQVEHPDPCMYVDEDGAPTFSLLPPATNENAVERFDSVDEAVRVCARKRLAHSRFEGSLKPLLGLIRKRLDHSLRSLGRVESELLRPSRGDRYEYEGHLIMSQPHLVESGSETVTIPDILGDGALVTIRLDSRLTAIENAQRLYEKAKTTRAARDVAMDRLEGLREHAEQLERLHADTLGIATVAEVREFEQANKALLGSLRSSGDDPDAIPYRRFDIGQGYGVWVGRNAKQNDELTLRDARPFDLWMHARGVAGSHTILRVKGRTDNPPGSIQEKAAAIAAWFSKARTSSLAPVIVTQRKYVRKPRGAAAGAVKVEREKVIMIEPALPVGQ